MSQHSHPRRSRAAFSIIELLIVIAIIAVLSAVLFPVFARAKDSGFQTAALLQAKQLGTGALMYMDEHDNKMAMSTNYAQGESSPGRIWTNTLMPYIKSEKVFVAPGTDGKFAKSWSDRGWQTLGYNSSTAYDPSQGCTDTQADQVGCAGFKKVASFDKQDNPSKSALFAVTPGGDVANKYLGYEFSPYNGNGKPEDPKLSPPLVSDRDLVKEMGELLPAELLKPIHARYMSTGSDDGRTPVVFGDSHVKDYSAKQIGDGASGIIWRLR